jgi:hypothetical protein
VCVQVCSYRVIASYENPLLEEFSKCILQRHNCLDNSAEIPMIPDPAPLSSFRNTELTWDAAEDIFIGHLSPQAPRAEGAKQPGFSWRVACGKNPGAGSSASFLQLAKCDATCASCGLCPSPRCAKPSSKHMKCILRQAYVLDSTMQTRYLT